MPLMHRCPQCGYEPLPEAITPPTILEPYYPGGKWRVRCWTNESDHAWIDEFDTKEEAEAMRAAIQAAREKAIAEYEKECEEDND